MTDINQQISPIVQAAAAAAQHQRSIRISLNARTVTAVVAALGALACTVLFLLGLSADADANTASAAWMATKYDDPQHDVLQRVSDDKSNTAELIWTWEHATLVVTAAAGLAAARTATNR